MKSCQAVCQLTLKGDDGREFHSTSKKSNKDNIEETFLDFGNTIAAHLQSNWLTKLKATNISLSCNFMAIASGSGLKRGTTSR